MTRRISVGRDNLSEASRLLRDAEIPHREVSSCAVTVDEPHYPEARWILRDLVKAHASAFVLVFTPDTEEAN